MRKIASTIAFCALLLSACTTVTPTYTAEQNTSQRSYRDALELEGRMSVQYQKNEQDEAIHVSFTWQQSKDRNTITILSPLGQILATIDIKPGLARLTQSGHAPRSAVDAATLAEQALGWPLPIAGLRYWLQGFATDTDNKIFIATPAQTQVLTRDGWNMQYMSWDSDHQTPQQPRPKRIDLTRQTEQAGKVMIRIVLDKWQPL